MVSVYIDLEIEIRLRFSCRDLDSTHFNLEFVQSGSQQKSLEDVYLFSEEKPEY